MRLLDLSTVVRELQASLDLTDDQLAWVVDVEPRTVQRWHENKNFPQGKNDERLSALYGVVRRLEEVFEDPAAATAWLATETRYLGNMTPKDALLARRIDRVTGALEALASGFFA